MPVAAPPFDLQASSFDRRAGLPAAAAEVVAGELAALCPAGRWWVEIGAGTGTIGRYGSGRHVGLDLSLGMLARFRAGSAVPLLAGDANQPWPLAAGSAGLVFLSRAAHLLDPDHLLSEFRRVAHPAGVYFVLGRVRRHGDSLRSRLRQEMHRRLALRGLPRREGRGAEQALLETLVRCGGVAEAPRSVATWAITERVADALSSWRSKSGLAGTALENPLRDEILAELEGWARETFASLEAERESTESYELAVAHLPATTLASMNSKEPA